MNSTIFINNILDHHQFSTCDDIQDNQFLATPLPDFESFLRRSCDVDSLKISNTTNPDYIKQSNIVVHINALFTIVTENDIICRSPWAAPVNHVNYQVNDEIVSDVKLIRNNLADMSHSMFFQYKPVYDLIKKVCSDHYNLRPIENYEVNFRSELPVIVFKKMHNQYTQFTCDNIADSKFLNTHTHNLEAVYALTNATNCAQSSYTQIPSGEIPTHVVIYDNEYDQCGQMTIILNNKYSIYMSDPSGVKVTVRHSNDKFLDYLKPLYQSLHLKPQLDERCLINNSTYKLEQHLKNPEYLDLSKITFDVSNSNILNYHSDTNKLYQNSSDNTDITPDYYINTSEESPITFNYPDNITNYYNDTSEIPSTTTASYSPYYLSGLTFLGSIAISSLVSYCFFKNHYIKHSLYVAAAETVVEAAKSLIDMTAPTGTPQELSGLLPNSNTDNS